MKFHIIFKKGIKDHHTTGITRNAESPFDAVFNFSEEFPEGIFMAMYSVDDVALLLKHQMTDHEDIKEAQRLSKTSSQ